MGRDETDVGRLSTMPDDDAVCGGDKLVSTRPAAAVAAGSGGDAAATSQTHHCHSSQIQISHSRTT